MEDSVTPSKKAEGRQNVLTVLSKDRASGIREQAVRINPVSTGLALDDLTEILKGKHLDCVVVPKVDQPSDLHFVTDVLRHYLPERHAAGSTNPVKIVALVESARSLMDLHAIAQASPFISGLTFAAEDFALDLSITRTPSLNEFTYARSAIVTAAKAFNIPSVMDLVTTSFRGEDGKRALQEESESVLCCWL